MCPFLPARAHGDHGHDPPRRPGCPRSPALPAGGRARGVPPPAGTEPGRGEMFPVPPRRPAGRAGADRDPPLSPAALPHSARSDPHPAVRIPAGSRARPASSARRRGFAGKLQGRSLASLAFFFFFSDRLPNWPRRPEGHMAQGRRTETVAGVKRNGQTKPKREVISCGCCRNSSPAPESSQ